MTDFSWLAVYDLNQMLDLASAINLSSGMSSQETQLTRAPVRQLAGRSDPSLHLHSRHDYLELASATWSRSHRRLATTEFQLARDSNVQPSTRQSVSTLLIIYCFNRWNVQVVNSNFKTIKFNGLCWRFRPVDSLTPTEGGWAIIAHLRRQLFVDGIKSAKRSGHMKRRLLGLVTNTCHHYDNNDVVTLPFAPFLSVHRPKRHVLFDR